MAPAAIKEEAKKIIDKLPDDSSRDDLMREIYVRQTIEAGIYDSKAGRTKNVEDVRK